MCIWAMIVLLKPLEWDLSPRKQLWEDKSTRFVSRMRSTCQSCKPIYYRWANLCQFNLNFFFVKACNSEIVVIASHEGNLYKINFMKVHKADAPNLVQSPTEDGTLKFCQTKPNQIKLWRKPNHCPCVLLYTFALSKLYNVYRNVFL